MSTEPQPPTLDGQKPRPPMGGDAAGVWYYDFTDSDGRYSHTRCVPKPAPAAAPKSAAQPKTRR